MRLRLNTGVEVFLDGPIEDQQAVASFIYYLGATGSASTIGGPFGTSNKTYDNHVFWDTDVWIVPAILFLNPQGAKTVAEARLAMAKVVDGTCRFPWESDLNGKDVNSGPTMNAEHQSGDVLLGLEMAFAHGLVSRKDVDRIGKAVARYYLARSTRNEAGESEIIDVTSVDEWFTGDNCLYTNAVADWTIKKYLGTDPRMSYPRNKQGELVAYEGDPERAYQQAAAPLVLWPLERDDLVADPIAFIERFQGKESGNGPAMSVSIYALLYARYGNADDAYKYWRRSWKDYTNGNPFLLFSERPGRQDLTYFSTGAAGCLNVVLYGFMGARIVDEPESGDSKIPMAGGKWLVLRPNLPSAWKSLLVRGLWVAGRRYEISCFGRKATVRPVPGA